MLASSLETKGGIVMKYCVENEIFGHLESIINGADRMTSGNFMHNKNAIKLSAKIIIDRLHSLGIYEKV